MKCSFLFLLFLIAHALGGRDIFGRWPDDDGSFGWVIRFKTRKEDPYLRTIPVSYYTAPDYKYTKTLEDALEWLKAEGKTEKDIYGVYELKTMQLSRIRAGTHKVTRNVPTKVEEPDFKWVQRDTNKVQQE